MDDKDLETRLGTLEQRAAVQDVREEMRAETDQRLFKAVRDLTSEVHELKSWKLRLQYPFAIVGVFVVGLFTAVGAYLVRFFIGE